MSWKAILVRTFLERIGSAGYGGTEEYEAALQCARDMEKQDYGDPDAWADDESSSDSLCDLLDTDFGAEAGAIREVNGIFYTSRKFAVVAFDENGCMEPQVFDEREQAEKFAAEITEKQPA